VSEISKELDTKIRAQAKIVADIVLCRKNWFLTNSKSNICFRRAEAAAMKKKIYGWRVGNAI